jgi:hypothetical protein
MSRGLCLALLYCLIPAVSPAWCQEGRLQSVRDAIHAPDNSNPSSGSNSGNDDSLCLGDEFGSLFGGAVLVVVGARFMFPVLPSAMIITARCFLAVILTRRAIRVT